MIPLFCYERESAQFGPFSATRMRALAAEGAILPTDQVWQEGTDRKCPASRVGNLFAGIAAVVAMDAPAALIEPAAASDGAVGHDVRAASETVESHRETLPPARTQRPPEPVRKKRVISIKGGQLMGQDGVSVQYRKKCSTCGWEDGCRSTAVIRTGTTRVTYFCRKCRKARSVEMQGVTS